MALLKEASEIFAFVAGTKTASKNLTKEQQKACLDSAAAELVREITQGRPLNQLSKDLSTSK
jgi:hypothetical protein